MNNEFKKAKYYLEDNLKIYALIIEFNNTTNPPQK